MPDQSDRTAEPPDERLPAAEEIGPAAPSDRGLLDDETSADLDRGASDLDQAASRLDQMGAGEGRSGSELDQTGADSDQAASNRDQATSDREIAEHPSDASRRLAHDVSRAERATATLKRGRTTERRGRTTERRARTAADRLEYAARRDETARIRDLAAAARDRAAEARDREGSLLEAASGPVDLARVARDAARSSRANAAVERVRAAGDRERAAHDREQASDDLKQAESEIRDAHIDELTGAYVRGVGTLALQREIDRARHADEKLVLAFVDVDGLKRVNDRSGHAAGDALLRGVTDAIRSKLRSYEPIVRVGGDEFICALSGIDLEIGQRRFAEIAEELRARQGTSISVGFTTLRRGDVLDDLKQRGDVALYEAKRDRLEDLADERPAGPT
jgi:diguanylate cyclase (GGDEF)-like protein